MKSFKNWIFGLLFLILGIAIVFGAVLITVNFVQSTIEQTANKIVSPLSETSNRLNTQISEMLHPTPTIIPDPVTIVHEVRAMARLETIQYSVEKVIRAEEGQNNIPLLFGDKMIFVAHGTVVAGIDLGKLGDQDIRINGKTLTVSLPEAEIFSVNLDNNKSYVYDRTTGIFSKGDANLETQARQVAQNEIQQAAIDDGIIAQAKVNGENFLGRFLRNLDYNDVIFNYHP